MSDEYKKVKIEGLPTTKNGGLRVELIPMPSGDNPWRTKADYIEEQRRNTIRFYIIIISFIVSIIAATISWSQMIEARKERIQAEIALKEANVAKKSVKETATAMLKISYIIADGSGRYGGTPKVHLDKIKEYHRSIEKFLDKEIEAEVKNDLKELNKAIENRNKK